MQERFSEKKNLPEFLKILGTMERKTKVSDVQMAELKSDLKKMIGKHVILLYFGQIAVNKMAKAGEYILQVWLDYIRESFEQVRDTYIIWYDDGLLDGVSKGLIKQEDVSDWRVDTQKMSEIYEKEKQKYMDCPWTSYINSASVEILTELADAGFGDPGRLSDIMLAQGKLFVEVDWLSLCNTPQSQTMKDWFRRILTIGNHDIPAAWRRKIQGKKVILYYMTAESFLHYGMAAVGKLEHVVSQLSMQSEFQLWYLEDQRVDGLLPCLRKDISERYLKVRENIRCGTGFFDNSGNVWRAISQADVYYGDWIEEINLLYRRGKPSLLQNIPGTVAPTGKVRQSPPLWPSTACRVGNSIWFVHGKLALLCRYSIKTQRTELVERIPGKVFFQESLYRGICHYQGKIFLLPSWADGRIVVYYICEHKFKFLHIPNEEDQGGRFFIEAFVYGKYLFALPQFYRYALRIDMDNLEIQVAGDCLGQAQAITPKAKYMNAVVKVNDHMVAGVFTNTNLVMLYDVATGEIQMRRVGGDNASYTSLTCMHDDLFLCDYVGKMLVKYSLPAQKIVATYSVPLESYMMHNLPNGIVMLDEIQYGKCCKIDWEGKIVSIEQREIHEGENTLYYAYTYGISFPDGSDLWYFDRCDYHAYCYHENGSVDVFELPWSDVDESFYNRQIIKMIPQECDMELPGGNFILQIRALMSEAGKRDSISNIGEKICMCIK